MVKLFMLWTGFFGVSFLCNPLLLFSLDGAFVVLHARLFGSGQTPVAGMFTSNLTAGSKIALNTSNLSLSAFPNPANNYFSVRITSSDVSNKITLRITDFSGKLIEAFSNINAGEAKQFGGRYASGAYIA